MDQVSTQNISLERERADSEAMYEYNTYLILKITIQNYVFSLTLTHKFRNSIYIQTNIRALFMTHSRNLKHIV